MNEKGKILVLCGLTLLLISILYVKFEQKGNAVSPYGNLDLSGKVNAPEFEGGRGWLNVERPLSLRKGFERQSCPGGFLDLLLHQLSSYSA
jgi:hypothetical protein